jgi:hypothetical protein
MLRIGVNMDMNEQIEASICRSLVEASGVVSITFEGIQIVVKVRTRSLARDCVFVDSIRTRIEECLRHFAGDENKKLLVETGAETLQPSLIDDEDSDKSSSCEDGPVYLDDDDHGADGISFSRFDHCREDDSGSQGSSADDGEPVYLDDSEDDIDSAGKSHGAKAWSLFDRGGWMDLRHLSEYEEDPTLVARLHRARMRSERRKREEEGRLHRLLSVITPLRILAQK